MQALTIVPVLGVKGRSLYVPVAHPKCMAMVNAGTAAQPAWRLCVVSREDGTVLVIDPVTMKIVGTPIVLAGQKVNPAALTAVMTHRLAVSAPGTGHLQLISVPSPTTSGVVEGGIVIPGGGDPKFLKSVGALIVAPLRDRGALFVYDFENSQSRPLIKVGSQPMDVEFVDSDTVWVALAGEGCLAEVDLTTGRIKTRLYFGEEFPNAVPYSVTLNGLRDQLWCQFANGAGAPDHLGVFDVSGEGELEIAFPARDFGDAGQRFLDGDENLVTTTANGIGVYSVDGEELAHQDFPGDAKREAGQPYGMVADPNNANRFYVGAKVWDAVFAFDLVSEPEKVAA